MKLDNGEILECDQISSTGVTPINLKIDLNDPYLLSRQFLKAATLALAIGYSRVRYISYKVDGIHCIKFIPTKEYGCLLSHDWVKLHKL